MNKKVKYFLIGSAFGPCLLGLQLLVSSLYTYDEDKYRAAAFVLLVAFLAGLIWTFVKDRKNRKTAVVIDNWYSLKKLARSAGFVLGTATLFFLCLCTVGIVGSNFDIGSFSCLASSALLLFISYVAWKIDNKNQAVESPGKLKTWLARFTRLFGFFFMSLGCVLLCCSLLILSDCFYDYLNYDFSAPLDSDLPLDLTAFYLLVSYALPTWTFFMKRSSSLRRLKYLLVTASLVLGCILLFDFSRPDYQLSNAFDGGKKLERYSGHASRFSVPEGVTEIGDYAFEDCSSLTSIVIPESVTVIGYGAFSGCSSLTSLVIPKGVTEIGDYAFYDCSSLTSLEIPEGVTAIGSYAFYDCSSLTSLEIPEGVTAIGSYAFYSCSSLTSLEIPEGVTEIGDYAFEGCSALSEINVAGENSNFLSNDGVLFDKYGRTLLKYPEGKKLERYCILENIEDIKRGAFAKASLLESINVAEDNLHYRSIDGVLFTKDVKTLIQFPVGMKKTEYVVPEGVTAIGNRAFDGCSSLTSIVIPESVEEIGNAAFRGCSSLTSIVVPEGVTSIGVAAFYGCSLLTSVVIPESVEVIGSYAFYNCSSLTSVVIPEDPTVIGNEVFRGCYQLTIRAPKGSHVEKYVRRIARRNYDYYLRFEPLRKEEGDASSILTTSDEEGVVFQKTIAGVEYGFAKDSVIVLGADASVKDLNIPDEIDGLPVLSIDKEAFRDRSFFSVKLPESLLRIGDEAFQGCALPERLELPDSVTEIGDASFKHATGLKEIKLSVALEEIGNYSFAGAGNLVDIEISGDNQRFKTIDGVLFTKGGEALIAYPDAKDDLTSYTVPEGVQSLSGGGFIGNRTLKEIVLPSSLEELDLNALPDRQDFTQITLPKNVSQIDAVLTGSGQRQFVVRVDSENKFFKDVDGVLYDKQGKTLVYFPITGQTTFRVPDDVEAIPRSAITNLKGIYIPASVKSVDDSFFVYYGKTTVFAPKGSFAEEYAKEHECKFVAMENGDDFPPEDFGENAGGSFETQIGKKMKLEGVCLDGSELDWESYRGKYVLVDFWTTWCGFCIREIPFNKKLYDHYHDAGFEIVAFSCDNDLDALRKFVEKNPEPWMIVSSEMSADAEKDYLNVPEFYEVDGYPTMVLVDPEGFIVDDNARGNHLKELLEKAFPDVTPLLTESGEEGEVDNENADAEDDSSDSLEDEEGKEDEEVDENVDSEDDPFVFLGDKEGKEDEEVDDENADSEDDPFAFLGDKEGKEDEEADNENVFDAEARRQLLYQRFQEAIRRSRENEKKVEWNDDPPENGIMELTIEGAKFVFRYCPPGSFTMGSPEDEPGRRIFEAQRDITLTKGFWLQETETTQKQWNAVVGGNPSVFTGANLPVENVSWFDYQRFVNKLNALNVAPYGYKFALPTEAQWEYAARGDSTGSRYGELDDIAWHEGDNDNKTHEVAQKEPNEWGFYDMIGNVWEWTSGTMVDDETDTATDPFNVGEFNSGRVFRGACFHSPEAQCRFA